MMNCAICGAADKWENVDRFRGKPAEMHLCHGCGFVGYPKNDQAKLKAFYETEYRGAPSIANVYTGQRKCHYHAAFLAPLLNGWRKAGLDKPSIFESGAAFGMALDWLRSEIPGAKLFGSELTVAMRRVAWYEYGIALGDRFDDSRQYDLIMSYKVAEHLPEVAKEIETYARALAPGGMIYISVPIWFRQLSNFGTDGFSLEYYYSTNHCNVWTRTLFETLLAKCGLAVEAQDHIIYESTYLCRVMTEDERKAVVPKYEVPAEILAKLEAVQKAAQAMEENRYSDAITAWPDFPIAHRAAYEASRAEHHKKGFPWIYENVCGAFFKASGETHAPNLFAADICMRYGQWGKAIQYLQRCLEMRPKDAGALLHYGQCIAKIAESEKDPEKKRKAWTDARAVMKTLSANSLQTQGEAVSWGFQFAAQMPMPHEKG